MTHTTRRAALSTLASAFALPALAQQKNAAPKAPADSDHGWYKLRSDEGKPFPNLRLPNELALQVERLPGLIRVGAETPDVTLIAFTDYNCPWCRRAAKDLDALVTGDADLRLGLVNNAILSPGSKEAAKVEMAVIKFHGRRKAYEFHKAMFTLSGHINAARALDVAADMGLNRAELADATEKDPELADALERQMKLADAMAFTTTPSFMVGTAGIIGYPGPNAMRSMVASMRQCELIACG